MQFFNMWVRFVTVDVLIACVRTFTAFDSQTVQYNISFPMCTVPTVLRVILLVVSHITAHCATVSYSFSAWCGVLTHEVQSRITTCGICSRSGSPCCMTIHKEHCRWKDNKSFCLWGIICSNSLLHTFAALGFGRTCAGLLGIWWRRPRIVLSFDWDAAWADRISFRGGGVHLGENWGAYTRPSVVSNVRRICMFSRVNPSPKIATRQKHVNHVRQEVYYTGFSVIIMLRKRPCLMSFQDVGHPRD